MKLGLVVYSNDAETVWNAFRLGVFSLKHGDAVSAFLLGKGVEAQNLDSEKFKVTDMMDQFAAAGGELLACGTCLKLRHTEDAGMCALSTLEDLHRLVRDCDKTLTF